MMLFYTFFYSLNLLILFHLLNRINQPSHFNFKLYLMSSLADKIKKNTKLKITAKGELNGMIGVVKYVGPIEDKKSEEYIGLQIDKPIGKNNGTVNGKQYFKTKMNHGVFLKPSSLVQLNGTPLVPAKPVAGSGANKLSNDLEVMANEGEQLKKQLDEMSMKLKEMEDTDWKKQIEEHRQKIKQLEQINRNLKMESEKVKYAVKENDVGKEKELSDQIQFFKSQKEAIEKEKADLKKKNAQLNAELEEYAGSLDMVDQLTLKIENLKEKNQKLKQELEASNGELKHLKMVGGEGGQSANEEELKENNKVLNQTIALLESDLQQAIEKSVQLQEQLKKQQTAMAQTKKMERKLKQKQEQIDQMALQLQACSDAANFAEKLTLDILKKDEALKETTKKINEYINQVENLEGELAASKEFSDELNSEILNQEQVLDQFSKQIEEKNRHVDELNRQIEKYKKKIFDLTQNSEAMGSNISQLSEDREEEVIPKSYLGFDQYQSKYYNALKVNQSLRQSFLKQQISFSEMRNQVGVYMLNLNETLPESFTSKLYPEVISTLIMIKSANDKLYYIFQTVISTFRNKSEIYSKENSDLCQWLILLMKEIIMLYGSLHKLEFSLTTSESEEQLSLILAHRVLKEEVRKIDTFAVQLLNRFADDNISASIDFDSFTSPIESLDEINMELKRTFTKEYDMKMRLCVEAMQTITSTYEMIISFKASSELGENAEVDNLLQNLTKSITMYLYECCMNPYIRYKAEMKQYLEGLSLINNIFNDIKLQGNYHELGSLYSQAENIKMLKDTILTTQYHVKQLLNDLKQIVYPNPLSKIQTQLTGKVWQDRMKLIREELTRVKQITDEKSQLEQSMIEMKKKVLFLERDLKDKQNTKQLYEKRIGELQLKTEQSTALESENKRQSEKIKSYEDANKLFEEQMLEQSKKRKLLEEQLRKVKQKYDVLQTETMMRTKKQKNTQSLSADDVANLTIFKNAIKESNTLRTLDVKKKMIQLKQSPIMNWSQKVQLNEDFRKISVARTRALDQISKFEVTDPLQAKKNANAVSIDSILLEINKLSLNNKKPDEKPKLYEIGKMFLAARGSKSATVVETKMAIRMH